MTAPNERPESREYLGRELGYCTGAAQVPTLDGRAFCTDHAKERDL